MSRNILKTALIVAGFLIAQIAPLNASAMEMMEVYSSEIPFEDAQANVEMAIAERGLVISAVSHVGEMLERTGRDLGATVKLYEQAEIYEFCSAVLSRKMMEADRRNVAFCPFAVSLYVVPEEPGKVYVAFRRPAVLAAPASAPALQEAEEMLRGIARETLELD